MDNGWKKDISSVWDLPWIFKFPAPWGPRGFEIFNPSTHGGGVLLHKIGTSPWVPIVVVGVNNSFHRILLHKSTILVSTIVNDI